MAHKKSSNDSVYKALFSKSRTINLLIDPESGEIVDANERAVEYYGYTHDELTSMRIQDINTLTPEEVQHEMKLARDERRNYFLFSHALKSGEVRQVEVYSSPISFDGTNLLYSVIFDVEESRQVRAQIEIEREQFRSVLDSIPHGIYVADMESYEVLFANRVMKEIVGYNPYGRRCYEVFQGKSEPCPFCTNPWIVDTDEPYVWEYHNDVLDRDFHVIDRRLRWTDGRWVRFEVAADITRQKRTERQLRELNETKNTLFSIVAHDLRSPFLNLMSLSRLLAEEWETLSHGEGQEYGRALLHSAESTYRLLDNLLAWTRSQTGRISFDPQPLHVAVLMERVLEVVRPSAVENNIDIEMALPPECVVSGDPEMIETVFRNLLFNAMKFSKPGDTVRVTAESLDGEAGARWRIFVRDEGLGMTREQQERLFTLDRGKRRLGTRNEKGSGLGLIVVKEFLDRHGAQIAVQSAPAEGTTISCTFPAV